MQQLWLEIDIDEFGGADKFFAANLESTTLMASTMVKFCLLKQGFYSTTQKCLKLQE